MPRKDKVHHLIYKTTNLINEKFYIGMHSTDNLNDGYVGSGKRLWYSINKHGKENFKLEILELLPDRISLKEREKEIVNSDLIKEEKCMNLRIGGEGGFSTEQQKINNEKSLKKQKWLWENDKMWADNKRTRMSNSLKGRVPSFINNSHSKETKTKIGLANSIKQKGILNSQFGTCWITDGKENKKIKKTDFQSYENSNWRLGRI
jgi:group I intron endonuclease